MMMRKDLRVLTNEELLREFKDRLMATVDRKAEEMFLEVTPTGVKKDAVNSRARSLWASSVRGIVSRILIDSGMKYIPAGRPIYFFDEGDKEVYLGAIVRGAVRIGGSLHASITDTTKGVFNIPAFITVEDDGLTFKIRLKPKDEKEAMAGAYRFLMAIADEVKDVEAEVKERVERGALNLGEVINIVQEVAEYAKEKWLKKLEKFEQEVRRTKSEG